MAHRPIIVVHGGAGLTKDFVDDPDKKRELERHVIEAARSGFRRLTSGGSAVDAVEAAVTCLEDDPIFNAGRGSNLTTAGEIEMDAAIMDGSNLSVGAVICITNVANPVSVARSVMEKTRHTAFAGPSATKLAHSFGFPHVPTEALITEKAMKIFKDRQPASVATAPESQAGEDQVEGKITADTVGAIAMDAQGNFSYASSTGGTPVKKPGRVGDAPMIGCGGYADSQIGAVATTGHGESFMKTCLAHRIISAMETGVSSQAATEQALDYMKTRVGGKGGCITLGLGGSVGVACNTLGMGWASITESSVHYGVLVGEDKEESL